MNYIGEKIKKLRRKNDMTQEKLADYLCVTYQTVSKWETGVTSPDLSLIVPLARLFKVTTDELFDFNESVEDIKRADLKRRYGETFKTGDMTVRMAVDEEAVKAYPGDMDWLNKYAWDVWCNAISIQKDDEFSGERDRAIGLFEKVIENCDDDGIKANAIVGIVQCLTGKGEYDRAQKYAELYPDTEISADEKKRLLISCMTGDKRIEKLQEQLLWHVENLLNELICDLCSQPEADSVAENIIKAFIPDGNYQTFYYHLYMIELSKARSFIKVGKYDDAVINMKKAREYATAHDQISGEYSYTAPLFNRIRHNTENWYQTGTGGLLDVFKLNFNFPVYSPLKSHKDYHELIK